MAKATKAQQQAILRKFKQSPDGSKSYREFRKRFRGYPWLGGMWCGMYLGIELDGHTHT